MHSLDHPLAWLPQTNLVHGKLPQAKIQKLPHKDQLHRLQAAQELLLLQGAVTVYLPLLMKANPSPVGYMCGKALLFPWALLTCRLKAVRVMQLRKSQMVPCLWQAQVHLGKQGQLPLHLPWHQQCPAREANSILWPR